MSGTLVALIRQKSAYRWLQQCRVPYLYRNVMKQLHVHSAVQYCISVKDKNTYLSKVKDIKFDEVTDASNLYTSSRVRKVPKQSVDELEGKNSNKNFASNERINKDILLHKRLERLYPTPKNSLLSIYAIVGNELNDQTVLTSRYKQNYKQSWEWTFNTKWPEIMSFKGVGRSKTVASKNAALKCLQWLEINGKLRNGKPIIYDAIQIKDMQSKSVELSVAPEILGDMKNLIETYNMDIRNKMTQQGEVSDTAFYETSHKIAPVHPIIGESVHTNLEARNNVLRNRLSERPDRNANLPIFEFRDEILSKLQDNRVLLIEGDTGCGKTTQVPQFIMDSFTQNGNVTDCNILVSQPRRISAISLADRVAYERGEIVGDVVGYQVRLDQTTPKELGGILFCTTGILLRKLQQNPGLEGCSHVILDEAHERSIDTDMLMTLLKRSLKQNPDLKVLIMSATINAHLFQRYFDCAAVKVPGRLYPVEMNFLEDIERLPNIQKYKSYMRNIRNDDDENEMLLVDFGKVAQIIRWISYNQPPGAILCFLPGWNEITRVQNLLEYIPLESEEQLILPIHSKMSHQAQRKIFEHTPTGTRKIILATDIAETGITVSDVCYVVDSAIRKEARWDYNKDLSCISNRWVSRANIHQRKGRAGRVKPGVSYHLITREEYEKLEPHPVAQVLCNSLEKVVLDSKTYTNEKAEEFLSSLLEPPNPTAIQRAVSYLIDLGVMDREENLTALGKRMALFPTHPKFSKALVYSTIFNCIHPVVTIASAFSGEENIFYGVLNGKHDIRKNKRLYHPVSDHIALSWIYKQWFIQNIENSHLVQRFCKQMKLKYGRMQILSQIRETFVQQLIMCRMLAKDIRYDYKRTDIEANKYEDNDELVRALLYSSTQQLVEHKNVGLKKGILRTGVNELRAQGRAKAVISGESVNYKRKVWPSPYLTYFHSAHCNTRRSTVIRETSMISPLTVLLFNQGETRCWEQKDDKIEIKIDVNKQHSIRFSCDKETCYVLLNFKDIMWHMVQHSLEKQGIGAHVGDCRQIFQYKNQLLETLTKTLRMSSKCIEDVQIDKSIA